MASTQPSREGASDRPRGWWLLSVDLSGSKLGPAWRRVDLVLDDDPLWPPHRMRHEAAHHYAVPMEQVGMPTFMREPVIPDPPEWQGE